MNSEEKYKALLEVQAQLNNYSAYYPEWLFRQRGNGELNKALQTMKKLIENAHTQMCLEESNLLDLYLEGCDNSISLHNMN
ncbi:hypothetical protein D3C75_1212370 [compost metagenome]